MRVNLTNGSSVLTKRPHGAVLPRVLCEDAVSNLQPRRGSSPETHRADVQISDFQPAELGGVNVCGL